MTLLTAPIAASGPSAGTGLAPPQPRFAVVIPVYNHPHTVAAVVTEIRRRYHEGAVIVVDDGSTDDTACALANVAAADALLGYPCELIIVRQSKNGGKGRALWRGFQEALARGYTHAATIDADRQHDVTDLLAIIAAGRSRPDQLIIGDRRMESCDVPARSRTGAALSRFWLQILTGQDVPDSQCGLRAYPLAPVLRLKHRFFRFDFETETLTRLGWAGLTIYSVPIACIYFPGKQRVTHFRPLADTLRGVWLNFYLVTRRLSPVPVTQLVYRNNTPGKKLLRHWWKLPAWREAVQRVLKSGLADAQLAAAVGVGVFLGVLPIWGLQTVLALYVAHRLHLNPAAVILGTQIGLPPITALWLYLSAEIGSLLLRAKFLTWPATQGSSFSWHTLLEFLRYISVGAVPVALIVATCSVLLTRGLLNVVRRRRARLPLLRRALAAGHLDES